MDSDLTEKDKEVLKKYNELPDLKLKSYQGDFTRGDLFLLLVSLGMIFFLGGFMAIIGNDEAEKMESNKIKIQQNVKVMTSCDNLTMMDILISRHESLTDPTRKAINDRMAELQC